MRNGKYCASAERLEPVGFELLVADEQQREQSGYPEPQYHLWGGLIFYIFETMFDSILKKFFAGLTAFLWADKKRLFLGFFASLWSVQHIACAYGTDEPCEGPCADPSLYCTPVFDVEKLSGNEYSECEQELADTLKFLSDCNESCAKEKFYNQSKREDSFFENEQMYCNDPSPYEGCGDYSVNGKMNNVYSVINNCPMDHIKAEGAMTSYKCGDGEIVSIEEGERRLNSWKNKAD